MFRRRLFDSKSLISTALRTRSPVVSVQLLHSTARPTRTPSFCFDIDGVLKQGEIVLEEAKEALQILNGKNKSNTKYPFILLTNGGGTLEADRAAKLSKELGVNIAEHQFIQNHSVYKDLAAEYKDLPVLVIGGQSDNCRKIAKQYGFNDVYIPADVLNWFPSIWSFEKLTPLEKSYVRQADFSKIHFSAVFVFHDSRDWGRDTQLIVDLVRSDKGVFGTVAAHNQPQIPVFFSAADLLWGNDFPQVRFGQGAFLKAVSSIYHAMTGKELQTIVSGKPSKTTYDYASSRLNSIIDSTAPLGTKVSGPVYMIGDNPLSDIKGANDYHDNWQSILVRTGVFRGEVNDLKNPADFVANNVLEGVLWALEKEKQDI